MNGIGSSPELIRVCLITMATVRTTTQASSDSYAKQGCSADTIWEKNGWLEETQNQLVQAVVGDRIYPWRGERTRDTCRGRSQEVERGSRGLLVSARCRLWVACTFAVQRNSTRHTITRTERH